MSNLNKDADDKPFHIEGSAVVFETNIEREERERREHLKHENDYKNGQLSIQRHTLYTQIGLVVFGLLGAITSVWQASVAQQSIDISYKNVLIAQETTRETKRNNQAQDQANKAGLQSTIDNFRQEQRAWVGLLKIEGVPEVGSVYRITPYYSNNGRTPALHLHYQAREILLPQNEVFVPNYGATRDASRSPGPSSEILWPNGVVAQRIRVSRNPANDEDLPIAQGDLDMLNKREKLLYVFGRACYKDVFDRPHWMRFCALYSPSDRGYITCSTYNEVDDVNSQNKETCTNHK